MKTFLLFISGMLTAALLVVLAVLLFWKGSATAPAPLSNVPMAMSPRIDPADAVTIKGTVVMPPAIRLYKPNEGRFRISLFYGPALEKFFPLDAQGSGAFFPRNIQVKIPRSKFAEILKDAQGNLIIMAFYSPGKWNGTNRSFFYFEPTAAAWQLPGERIQPKNGIVDLGNITFNQVAKQAFYEKCVGDKVLLQGQVLPPPSTEKTFVNKKIALVLYANAPLSSQAPADLGKGTTENLLLHSQFLDFSKGPVSFSVPWKQTISSILKLVAVACEASEDLKNCSSKAFPLVNSIKHFGQLVVLQNKYLEAPICGETDFTAVFAEHVNN